MANFFYVLNAPSMLVSYVSLGILNASPNESGGIDLKSEAHLK